MIIRYKRELITDACLIHCNIDIETVQPIYSGRFIYGQTSSHAWNNENNEPYHTKKMIPCPWSRPDWRRSNLPVRWHLSKRIRSKTVNPHPCCSGKTTRSDQKSNKKGRKIVFLSSLVQRLHGIQGMSVSSNSGLSKKTTMRPAWSDITAESQTR